MNIKQLVDLRIIWLTEQQPVLILVMKKQYIVEQLPDALRHMEYVSECCRGKYM